MKENSQINRVNYANNKHHIQVLRQNIDSQLISQIQTSQHPSLKYQCAFKNVYMDQLEKTVLYQQQKKLGQTLSQVQSAGNLASTPYSSPKSIGGSAYPQRPAFTDYDEQRRKKFENLINRGGYGEGGLMFKAQDQYQMKKLEQQQMTKTFLKQQLWMKDQKKQKQNEQHQLVAEEVRYNTMKHMEQEQERIIRAKEERQNERKNIQSMIEEERARKERRSLVKVGEQSRHNPITNPIEYHIDNPYILQKIQRKMYS